MGRQTHGSCQAAISRYLHSVAGTARAEASPVHCASAQVRLASRRAGRVQPLESIVPRRTNQPEECAILTRTRPDEMGYFHKIS